MKSSFESFKTQLTTKLVDRRYDVLCIVVITAASLSFLNLYGGRELLWGNDSQIPLNVAVFNFRQWFVWDNSLSLPDPAGFASVIPLGLFFKFITFLSLPYSASVFEKLLLLLLYASSGVSMYALFSVVFHGDSNRQIGGLAAALFYMFNFYEMLTIWDSLAYLFFHYAFFPLVLALYIKGINERKGLLFATLTAVVWTLTITPAYITVPMVGLDWFTILFYLFVYLIATRRVDIAIRSMLFSLVLVAVWIGLNLFWILPDFSSIGVFVSSYVPSSLGFFQSQSVSVLAALRFMGYLGLTEGYRGFLFYPWYQYYESPLLILISFIPILLAALGVILARKSKEILFFFILVVGGVFLVKGIDPPFGQINLWLFSNALLQTAFRSVYQRFMTYIVMGCAPLIGIFFTKFFPSQWKIDKLSKLRIAIVLVLIILMCGPLVSPFWTGSLYSSNGVLSSMRVTFPQSYYQASDWLNNQTGQFSVLPLPFPNATDFMPLDFQNRSNGYIGIYPFILLSQKPFITDNKFAGSMVDGMIENSITNSSVLNMLNIKYVVLQMDADWAYMQGNNNYISGSPSELMTALNSVTGLKLVESFGSLYFFLNTYWTQMQVYTTDSSLAQSSFSEAEIKISVQSSILTPLPNTSSHGSVKYNSVVQSNNMTSFAMILPQTYDPGWQVSVNGNPVNSNEHFEAFGYINGWSISCTPVCAISIYYQPQQIVDRGMLASLISSVAVICFIALVMLRNVTRSKFMHNFSSRRWFLC